MLANLKDKHQHSSKLSVSNKMYNLSQGNTTVEIKYQDGSVYKGGFQRLDNGGIKREGKGVQSWEDGTK